MFFLFFLIASFVIVGGIIISGREVLFSLRVFAVLAFVGCFVSLIETCRLYDKTLPDPASHAVGSVLSAAVAGVGGFFGQPEVAVPAGATALKELWDAFSASDEKDRLETRRSFFAGLTLFLLVFGTVSTGAAILIHRRAPNNALQRTAGAARLGPPRPSPRRR